MDGHGSHCTREFIEYAQEKHIQLFVIPPHSTHFLQPLDVVIFQPFKSHHTRLVANTTRSGQNEFNRSDFFTALDSIRAKTFKQSTILSGWRETGIIPFKPEVVLQKLRYIQPPTPPPPPQQVFRTPTNTIGLYQVGDLLNHRAEELSPSFRSQLVSFVKGATEMAELAGLMRRRIEISDEAIQLKHKLNARKNRRLQSGGTLSAEQARNIATDRDAKSKKKGMRKKATNPKTKTPATEHNQEPIPLAPPAESSAMGAIREGEKDDMLRDFIPFDWVED